MPLIKLDAIDSTNVFLKQLVTSTETENGTVVVAKTQLAGRGQMGASWQSEPGKNLTFSLYHKPTALNTDHLFYLSMITALAVIDALKPLHLPNLQIKWPNDILSDSSKICGILIETLNQGIHVQGAIIGIGLNVNQTSFKELPGASSLRLLTGKVYDLDELLHDFLKPFKCWSSMLDEGKFREIHNSYESLLFRWNKPSAFSNPEGNHFMGIIKGVNPNGTLRVLLAEEEYRDFDLKEIRLLY